MLNELREKISKRKNNAIILKQIKDCKKAIDAVKSDYGKKLLTVDQCSEKLEKISDTLDKILSTYEDEITSSKRLRNYFEKVGFSVYHTNRIITRQESKYYPSI